MQRLLANQAFTYFAKAIILVGILMFAANVAPLLPSVTLPLLIIAYAAVATIGALYHTVMHRLHKQKKLTATGALAKLNRKWATWLIGYLVLFAVSGFFFLLDAPTWNGYEWLLTWLAIPLYYGVFVIVRIRLRKEYAPTYVKAQSMLLSFWVAGIILCLLYALVSMTLGHAEYGTLRAAFDATRSPFEGASSALMEEAGYAASFANGLTSFALAQVEATSFAVGFVCQFVIYALALFGLVNQFGFCLLGAQEIKAEFQILPADGEDAEASKRVLKRYIAIVTVAVVLIYGVFLAFEFETAKLQASGGATTLRTAIEEQKERLIRMVDGTIELEQQVETAGQRIEDIKAQRYEVLAPQINGYYDACANNVDAYLDWYYSPFGGIAKLFGNLDDARKTFKERITNGVDDAAINESYQAFASQISEVEAQVQDSLYEFADVPTDLRVQSGSQEASLDLWQPLDDPQDDAELKRILLGEGENWDREAMKAQLTEFIDGVRERTFSILSPS